LTGAREISAHLEGVSEGNGWWRCLCPLHNGHSLTIKDGIGGRLLVKCFGGCSADDVRRKLHSLELLGDDAPAPLTPEHIAAQKATEARNRRRRIAQAHEIFAEGVEVRDTLADLYLRSRGTDPFSPYFASNAALVLRFHPWCYHSPGVHRPALLARVDHVEHGHVATHITYLAPDGSTKTTLAPPRKTFGPRKGGAVQLAAPKAGERFVIGEGIESTLSVMVSCSMPGWAALCAEGITALDLPREATDLVIAADNDANGVGQRAAQDATRRFIREGRRVRIAIPPRPSGVKKVDFNDVLLGKTGAHG
jgi:putative DNA primase/helicase